MTATKKSKLGLSISKVLSRGNEADQDKAILLPDENVTPIDSKLEKLNRRPEKSDSDPFRQAANSGKDEIISFDSTAETDETAIEAHVQEPQEIKPQKFKPKKVKTASNQKNASTLVSGVAIAFSTIAILGSGYSILSQDGIKQKLSEDFASLELSISDLTDHSDLFQSSLSNVKSDVATNTTEIGNIRNLNGDIQSIHQSIKGIRDEANQVSELINAHKQTLGDHDKDIADLLKNVEKLNERPTQVVKRVVQAEPKPVVSNSNVIEGASLATIDRWGAQSYVVLRDENGKWIPMKHGDTYKGWIYSGLVGEEALFKKGSQSKKLTVES